MKKSTIIVLVVIVAIAAFAGGTFYGKASVPAATTGGRGAFASGTGSFTRTGSSTGGVGGRFGGAGGAGFTTGQIISEDSQSITVQMANGNSEVVFYSPSTQIMVTKTSMGTPSDLAIGTTVIISSSTANSDGSITASGIMVREGGMTGAGAGFPGTGGTAQ